MVFFGPEDREGKIAIENHGLDSCRGHPAPSGVYHYHSTPGCVHKDAPNQHSPVIGYAFDGFKYTDSRAKEVVHRKIWINATVIQTKTEVIITTPHKIPPLCSAAIEAHRHWQTMIATSKALDRVMKKEEEAAVTPCVNTAKQIAKDIALICHPAVK